MTTEKPMRLIEIKQNKKQTYAVCFFFEVVFRPFKQGTVQSFNGQQSFVKSNCERSCCTVNSRKKGKYTLLYHFCKVVLHCTTRRRKQFERLRTRKKISLQHKAIKGYCPQNAFSKSTCKLLKIDQVSCRSVSKSCYRVQVFGTLR